MPIKFRCRHCHQFLGISQSKAGMVVDCPTCGRSVRVPELDGRVAPLPQPKLNLNDASLVNALDALASIDHPLQERTAEQGGEGASGDRDASSSADSFGEETANHIAERSTPRAAAHAVELEPLAEPIPLEPEPLAPSEPVVLKPAPEELSGTGEVAPFSVEAELAKLTSADSEAVGDGESMATDSPVLRERRDPRAADSAHSPKPTDVTAKGRRTRDPVSSWWRVPVCSPLLMALIVAGTAPVMFGLGFLWGSGAGANARGTETAGIDSETDGGVSAGGASAELKSALKGRITYRTMDGGNRPDQGARVLVLPPDRPGAARISIVGLRAGDDEADYALAEAGLQALGGAVALVDDQGQFELSLPTAGRYHVVVLSRYQARESDRPIASELRRLLDQYFDRPEQLLGRFAYHWGTIRYSGTEAGLWDHSFPREP